MRLHSLKNLVLKVHGAVDTSVGVLPFEIFVYFGLQFRIRRIPMIRYIFGPGQIAKNSDAVQRKIFSGLS